jgi:hypothetical protein
MSNVFTLESLVEEIEREYAPLKFQAGGEEFVLKSLMRTDRKVRDAVVERLKSLEAAHNSDEAVDEGELLEGIAFVLSSVTEGRKGARLMKVVGEDVLLGMKLLEKWTAATQPGEAKDSPTS